MTVGGETFNELKGFVKNTFRFEKWFWDQPSAMRFMQGLIMVANDNKRQFADATLFKFNSEKEIL